MLCQMLPVPGSIEKYFRENILQISRVLAVLISRLCTADSATLVVFRGSLLLYQGLYSACGILLCFKYFRDMYCGYCQVLAVFRPVGTASTGTASSASTRSSTKLLSICVVNGECKVYFDHLSGCTAVSTISSAFFCRQHSLFTDSPTNGG